jgi:hypothetical protein
MPLSAKLSSGVCELCSKVSHGRLHCQALVKLDDSHTVLKRRVRVALYDCRRLWVALSPDLRLPLRRASPLTFFDY